MIDGVCCFSGHRVILKSEQSEVARKTEEVIRSLISSGITTFIAGGALGFDTLAAEIVLKIKRENPEVKLEIVVPCADQHKLWKEHDRIKYERILEMADQTIFLSETYYRGCMHYRNRYMVDSSAVCVCYQKKPTGGTAHTVNYAESKGLKIINVANP